MSFAEHKWKVPENRQGLGFRAVGQDFKSPADAFARVFEFGSECAFGGNHLILIAWQLCITERSRAAQAGIPDGN